jgi:hypothetical protein
MATLEQFLRTGDLGPLHVRMSEAEIITLLGSPLDESVSRNPHILKYDGLQLAFLKGPGAADHKLTNIGLYFGPHAKTLPEPTRPTDFKCSDETTMAEVRAFLAQANFRDFLIDDDEETSYVVMASGARITFEDQKLKSINFAAPTAKPAKHQLAVSVSKETLNQLRTVAKESNRSVSELCAEWIADRANAVKMR